MHKPTRVIVVGPDGCGKSEIAHELSRRTGVKYFKARGEKANFRSGGNKFLDELLIAEPRQLDLIEQLELPFIADRGYPCEYAYARVFERETDNEALKWSDGEYARLGTKIVLCTRSVYKLYDDSDYAGAIKPEILYALDAAYREFLSMSECPVLILNVDDEDLDREIADIVKFLST